MLYNLIIKHTIRSYIMANKHIAELLIETNKGISNLINKIQNDDSQNDKMIIENLNDAIRQLDKIVEDLERR